MSIWNENRKVRAVAANLAQAMRRRYGPEAEAVCREALARRELIGARRTVTRLALQFLAEFSKPSDKSPAIGHGPASPA